MYLLIEAFSYIIPAFFPSKTRNPTKAKYIPPAVIAHPAQEEECDSFNGTR